LFRIVVGSLVASGDVEGEVVPLTGSVSFKAVLQKGNRVQVPKLVRWKFKLEQDQVLKVSVATQSLYG
jgi:hypothetical protein